MKKIKDMTDEELRRNKLEFEEKQRRVGKIQAILKLLRIGLVLVLIMIVIMIISKTFSKENMQKVEKELNPTNTTDNGNEIVTHYYEDQQKELENWLSGKR